MDPRIDAAFRFAPRQNFLPPEVSELAHMDAPLPIGFGQTNSQPSTVANMLQWLDVRPGQKVLDVGSGSGWTSALLARLTGPKGSVVAVETVPELVGFGRRNVQRLGLTNVSFHEAGSVYGWPQQAPYDRILVSAAGRHLPQELLDQLARGGRMVIPVENRILVIGKDESGSLSQAEHHGYVFVPLI